MTRTERPSNHSSQQKFRACLFDMDGLLINSEPIYTQITSKLLRDNFGITDGLSWEVKSQIQGLPGHKAIDILIDHFHLQDRVTPEQFDKLGQQLQSEFWGKVGLMPGALELVKYLKFEAHVPICVCTSTKCSKFKMKTSHLDELFDLFDDNIITGDHEGLKGNGKPNPDIWWLGLAKLNEDRVKKGLDEIKSSECLVFEDALNGALSGKRSGGYVIWIPDHENLKTLSQDVINDIIGENNENGVILEHLSQFEPGEFGL
ncbi:unnamed protein product [Ambrosiozyma monospora]|uniref:Unnamed protein product n=1 Tax=Ambrosiozyma monospora TaxID=43982 RepID=A0ACB5U8R2_AMBMO|nr:unnamed protein product [Ambrosiozyma monospora]